MSNGFSRLRRRKVLRDAVHFDIDFDEDEIRLMNTREFQRLRRIKQLGLAYLVYPSASHSRFEHVLGVCHMAQRIIDTVNRDEEKIGPTDRKIIRYHALLHDIGHVPFGHTLEDERPVLEEKHESKERLEHFLFDTSIANEMEKAERELDLPKLRDTLMSILCSPGKKRGDRRSTKPNAKQGLYADIVGNTICADLLDYLKRDTLFSGIQHRYDDRIISSFRVSEKHELFIDLTDDRTARTGLISEILHMLRLRYTLGERVYYHRTKSAASAMISKAVELLNLRARDLYDLGDDELLFLLENPDILQDKVPDVKDVSASAKQAAQRLAAHIRKRSIYEPVYRVIRAEADEKHKTNELVASYHKVSGMSDRQAFEDEIVKRAGLKEGQVIIYCPDADMSLKEAEVKVRFSPTVDLEQLKDVRDRHVVDDIKALEEKHKSLWSLEVFVDPDAMVENAKKVALLCTERWPELTNDIVEFRPDPMEIARHDALLEALDASSTKDYSKFRELLAAAHKKGLKDLTTAKQWREAFPDILGAGSLFGETNDEK